MPARTGLEYLRGLREQRRDVRICGERVKDVTTHPAFHNGARSVAALYDMQHDPALQEDMTYPSPTTGDRVGLSFVTPQTLHDLEHRRTMMTHWAQASCGMMARTPDFLNVAFMAMAAASDYFGASRPEFKTNMQRYYEFLREGDVTLTHTLVNPQRTRSVSLTDRLQEEIALTVVRETSAGIVVRGCRILATLGPLSDEIAVYPARTHLTSEDAGRLAFAFAIPCGTPGLKFLCRESFDLGRSTFDHPLGSRFEEMDAVVFFDDVVVPWERVFLLGDVERCKDFLLRTNAAAHTAHQVVTRMVAKAEFLLGLAALMVRSLGSGQIPHVQERVAELITHAEVLKACLRASEADAAVDQWGVMSPAFMPLTVARNLFARTIYPRMAEIIELLGSSSLMAAPAEADFRTDLAPEIERYLATDTSTARERAKLFHLAWDVTCSAFGGRQVLYERFFGGDPVRNAMILYHLYDSKPLMERVLDFLQRDE
jgi:4-hydroxyphenylacetate 3-monooxygenase